MSEVGSAEVVLTARLDRFERDLRQAEGDLKGFSSRGTTAVSGLGGALTALGARGGAAVGGLGAKLTGLASTATASFGALKVSGAAAIAGLGANLTALGASGAAAFGNLRGAGIAAGVSVAAIGAAVAGTAAVVKRQIDQIDEIGLAARNLGLSSRELSGLSVSASLANVSLSELGRGLAQLSTKIEASRRSGKAGKVFDQLGIDPQSGASATEVLYQVSDAFAAMSAGAARTTLARELFGRGGVGMVEVLSQGSAALRKQADEARRLGMVFDDVDAALADKLNDDLDRLGMAATGTAREIATALLPALSSAAADLTEWVMVNREVLETDLSGYFRDLMPVIEGVVSALSAGNDALNMFAGSVASLRTGGNVNDIQQGVARRLRARGLTQGELLASSDMPGLMSTAADAPVEAPTPASVPPPVVALSTGSASKASKTKPRTAADHLGDSIALQRDLAAAAESRISKQIELAERQEAGQVKINALHRERLELVESTLASEVAMLRSQGTDPGGLARAEADLANVQADLAAPTAAVVDSFAAVSASATALSSTLRDDMLASVKQFVVGIAQGTAKFKDLPSILSQSMAGNVTSRLFDASFGAGGLFGTGTGAGDFRSFGAGIKSAFGFDAFGAQVMPEGFVGPPPPASGFQRFGAGLGVGSAIGGFGAAIGQAAGIPTTGLTLGALAGGAVGSFAGPAGAGVGAVVGAALGYLAETFKGRPSAASKDRATLDAAFKAAGVFPTLALAKSPPAEFRPGARSVSDILAFNFGLRVPGQFQGMQDESAALFNLLGEPFRVENRGTLASRAQYLGQSPDEALRELRQVARGSGVSLEEGVFNLTNEFLRFQQEGKGSAITQDEYNKRLKATVKLLQDDLPFAIDASSLALDTMQQFGRQQIADLDALNEALTETAEAAGNFAGAITSGIAQAVKSGDIMDVSRSLAEAFSSEFLRTATKDLLENGALADDMATAIALYRDLGSANAAGDFATAAQITAKLGDTFAGAASTIQQQAAPLVSLARGFEASLGVATSQGIIRQGGATLIVQNIVDGRVISESMHNTERLQRGGGVIVPQRVGTN